MNFLKLELENELFLLKKCNFWTKMAILNDFIGQGWALKPPLNIYNLAKNGPFL